MSKEQRSISHSAILRDGLSNFIQKQQHFPPPSNKDLLNSISNINNDSTASIENKMKFSKVVDQFITKSSGSYQNNINDNQQCQYQQHQQDECSVGDESTQVLHSIRSVRTLKSLQNERMMRKSSRQRGDENDECSSQHKGNEIRKSSISRQEHPDQRIGAKNSNSARNQSVQQSHQYGIANFTDNKQHSNNQLLVVPPAAAIRSKHARQQSKSSQDLINMPPHSESNQNHSLFLGQQQNQFNTKRASMAKGERQSFGSDQSIIDDIPSEGVCRFSSVEDNSSIRISQLNKLNQGCQKKMQELVPFSSRFQVSGPNLKQQAHQLFSINTVRDSSPLKTITQCQADTKMFKSIKPSAPNMTDRGSKNGGIASRENHELYSHFFPRHHSSSQVQVARTYGTRLESKDVSASFKQPKQGAKKVSLVKQQYITENANNLEQQQAAQNKYQQYHTTNVDNENNHNLSINYNAAAMDIQSLEDDHVSDESPSNTHQSIHIPKTLALQGQNSKICTNLANSLSTNNNSSNNPKQQIDSTALENQKKMSQSQNQHQLQHNPLLSNLYNAKPQKKVSNNLRTESLERILGDKAESFFNQMEKMQRKEFVKVNRSSNFDKENSDTKNFATKQAHTIQQQSMMFLTSNNNADDEKMIAKLNLTHNNQLLGQDQQSNKNSPYISEENFTNNINIRLQEAKSSQFQVFPVSVKDKIKNITSRIKNEIQKQEEFQLGNRKKTGSGAANDTSQNTIQSIYYKDQFKKYINVDKQEELQKNQRYQEKSVLRQKQQLLQKGKENVLIPQPVTSLVCKTERARTNKDKGKRVLSPCRLPNGKSSLIQQKKPHTAGDHISKAKVQQQNAFTNNNNNSKNRSKAATSSRKQSDTNQCIIYATSKFSEILTTQENFDEDILSPQVIKPKISLQPMKEHYSNNNKHGEGGLITTNLTEDSPPKLKEASIDYNDLKQPEQYFDKSGSVNVVQELEDYFQQSLQNKADHEALIKSKLSHLLKETRTKMKKYEDIKLATATSKESTPTNSSVRLSHILSSVSLNLNSKDQQMFKQQQQIVPSSSFIVASPQRANNQQFFLNSNPFTPSNKKQLVGCYQGAGAAEQQEPSVDKLEYSSFSDAPFVVANRNQMHSQQVIRGDEIVYQSTQGAANNNNNNNLALFKYQQQLMYLNEGVYNPQHLLQNNNNIIQFETAYHLQQQQIRLNQEQNRQQMAAYGVQPAVINHPSQQQHQYQDFINYPQQLTPMAQSMQQLNHSALLHPSQRFQQQQHVIPQYHQQQQTSFIPSQQYNNQDMSAGYYSNSSTNLLGFPNPGGMYFIPSNDTSMYIPFQQQQQRYQQLPVMTIGPTAGSMNNLFPQTTLAAVNTQNSSINYHFLGQQSNSHQPLQGTRISLITRENLKQFNAQPDNHKASIQFKVDKALFISKNDESYD